MADLYDLSDHQIRSFILDDGCNLCPHTIWGGEPRVVQLVDGLPAHQAHIGCAISSGAVSQRWADAALKWWCDERNAGRRW